MDLKYLFPRASNDFLEANASRTSAKPQRPVRAQQVGTVQAQETHSKRRILRIISYRTRPCDTDNLCPKWFIDALRYAGVIEDDTPEHIQLVLQQEKVSHRDEEKTRIEIEI